MIRPLYRPSVWPYTVAARWALAAAQREDLASRPTHLDEARQLAAIAKRARKAAKRVEDARRTEEGRGLRGGFGDHAARAEVCLSRPGVPAAMAGRHESWSWATDGHAFLRWHGPPTATRGPDVARRQFEDIGAALMQPSTPLRRVSVDGRRFLADVDLFIDPQLVERWTPAGFEPTSVRRVGSASQPCLVEGDDWQLLVMPCRVVLVVEGWSDA